MENGNLKSDNHKQCDKSEKLEIAHFLDKYKYELQDDEINLHSTTERSALQCIECKIIRVTKEKFLNHLNSRRHLRIIEMKGKG